MTQQHSSVLVDGSFVGISGRYWLVLRVDLHDETGETKKRGTVSGDIQSTGPEDGAGFASFQSRGPVHVGDLAGAVPIQWIATAGATATGSLHLSSGPDDTWQVTLEAQADVGNIPGSTPIVLEVRRATSTLRDLTVQLAIEDGQPGGERSGLSDDEAEEFASRVSDWWRRAGFRVRTRQTRLPQIPTPEAGWTESAIFSALQTTLTRAGSAPDDRPNWDVRLLLLSGTDRTGLEGVMFDLDDKRPRQGAAIFVDAIRSHQPDPDRAARRLLKAAVHELGHALNLRHRFDPVVRRTQSLSPMTYDWLYPGGPDKYWEGYGEGVFDEDELTFLRHAPRSQIIPGGAPFGSAVYWESGLLDTNLATAAEQPLANLSLWLTPPAAGTTFLHGQPIFLEVSLLNNGAKTIRVPHHILDLKAGRLALLIDRAADPARPGQSSPPAEPFTPILQRCYSPRDAQWFHLRYRDSLHSNVNLSYGSGGPTFADPGRYSVTPVLTFPSDSRDGLDQIIVGPALHIRVQPAQTRADARDADTLLSRADIGITLALGGATCFEAAAGELAEIRDRRSWDTAGSSPDPIAVALARTSGLFEQRKGRDKEAAALLRQATQPEARHVFDPHTAEHTRRLAASLDPTGVQDDPTRVVVDLWTAPAVGRPLSGGRSSGRLITRGSPSANTCVGDGTGAWGVLTPASQLPAEAMEEGQEITAVVTVASGNGVTQRVSACRIDLVPDTDKTTPGLAVIELSQPLPIRPEFNDDPVDNIGGTVASFFGSAGKQIVNSTGAALNPWTEAADQALANAPRPQNPLPPTSATVHRYPGFTINDVAGWACWILGRCQEPDPAAGVDEKYGKYKVVYVPGSGQPEDSNGTPASSAAPSSPAAPTTTATPTTTASQQDPLTAQG